MNVYISIPITGRDLTEAKLHTDWLKALDYKLLKSTIANVGQSV